jgi:hypothetical protein
MAGLEGRASAQPGHRNDQPERREQTALIQWRDVHSRPGAPDRIEELRWLHSSLNGERLPPGQAARARAAGMTAGVWDLFLPVVCWAGGQIIHPGLYIEMKVVGNDLSDTQREFRGHLLRQGYQTRVCYSWGDAARQVLAYLGVPRSHAAWQGLGQ